MKKPMSFTRKIFIISVVSILWSSCGGGSLPRVLPQAGRAEFYLTDQAGVPYTAVWLKIRQVDVHSPDAGWKTVFSFDPPVDVNVLELQKLRKFLGMVTLPEGNYDGIRLVLTEVRVVENGAVRFIPVPDSVILSATFQIRPDGVLEITVDINVDQVIPPGTYQFSQEGIVVIVRSRPSAPPPMPPPPNPPPEQRPLLFTGVIDSLNTAERSFLLTAHPLIPPSRMGVSIPGWQVKILTNTDTRYFPEGTTFETLQAGDSVDVVAVPATASPQPSYLALEVFLLKKSLPVDLVEGWVLESLPDQRLVKISLMRDDDWIIHTPGGPQRPEFFPPKHFLWIKGIPETEIFDENGTPLSWVDIQVGMFLAATGTWRSRDLFEARKIRVQRQSPPSQDEIFGYIGLLEPENTRFLLIAHAERVCILIYPPPPGCFKKIWIKTTPETRFEKSDGTPLSFEDLRVGMLVKVKGAYFSSGDFLALMVVVVSSMEPPPEIFSGTVVEKWVEGRKKFLRVANEQESRIVRVLDSAVIVDENGNPFSFDEIQVGHYLRIQGEMDESDPQVLNAKYILVQTGPTHQVKAELFGIITEKKPDVPSLIVVDQQAKRWEVLVDAETLYQDSEGNPLSYNDLKVTDKVWVLGFMQAEDTILARLVTRIPEMPPPPEINVRGIIMEFRPPARFIVREWDGTLWSVAVVEQSRIYDKHGHLMSYAQLRVGQEVTVWGNIRNGRDVDASVVRVLDEIEPPSQGGVLAGIMGRIYPDDEKFFLSPPFFSPGMSSPPPQGIWVKWSENTRIYDQNRNIISIFDVPMGSFLAVVVSSEDSSPYPCSEGCLSSEVKALAIYFISSTPPLHYLQGYVAGKQSLPDGSYMLTLRDAVSNMLNNFLIRVPQNALALNGLTGMELNFDSWSLQDFVAVYTDSPSDAPEILAQLMVLHPPMPVGR
ncbi:MAG: DUF5666 domain-containing protein [bacterium JZ-2024 1]